MLNRGTHQNLAELQSIAEKMIGRMGENPIHTFRTALTSIEMLVKRNVTFQSLFTFLF